MYEQHTWTLRIKLNILNIIVDVVVKAIRPSSWWAWGHFQDNKKLKKVNLHYECFKANCYEKFCMECCRIGSCEKCQEKFFLNFILDVPSIFLLSLQSSIHSKRRNVTQHAALFLFSHFGANCLLYCYSDLAMFSIAHKPYTYICHL